MEAKSYISRMDLVIGSRMHATIAAFSVGAPTIPVAYSRKFEGMFGSLGYPAVVDLSSLDSEEAVDRVLEHVRDAERLAGLVAEGLHVAEYRLDEFGRQAAVLLGVEPTSPAPITT